MLVLDIETTGIDPHKHSIVSIGAVDFLNPARQFYEECIIWEGAHVMDEAMEVNGFSREEITDPSKKTEEESLRAFLAWAMDSENHTIGGQNPFFDVSFIQTGSHRYHLDFSLAQRIIDLHSICYFHILKRGLKPPTEKKRSDLNSDKIMKYVGIPAEPKPHIALNGAIYEAEAFSRLIKEESMFDEFREFPIPWKE